MVEIFKSILDFLQSHNNIDLCVVMEFWLSFDLIFVVVIRQILYLQKYHVKK